MTAPLTVALAARTGVDMVGVSCASGGDSFANDGQEIIQVFNGDSGSHSVTVVTQAAPDGGAVTALTVAIAAGVTKTLGPFPTGVYNDTNGLVQITYTAVTSMTIKVLKVPPA